MSGQKETFIPRELPYSVIIEPRREGVYPQSLF